MADTLQFRGRTMIPSGRGHVVPLPLNAPAISEHDARLRRQLVGAFEPWVGHCIVNEGLLTFAANGQAHCYVTREQAQAVLDGIGQPKGYDIVELLAADRASCAQTMV